MCLTFRLCVRYIQAFVSEGLLHIVMDYASGGKLPLIGWLVGWLVGRTVG